MSRHALPLFFITVIAVSWSGILLVVGGPSGFAGKTAHTDPRFPFVYLAMLAGPVLSTILFTALLYGRAGFRSLGARLLEWRVSARWYLVALLTAPIAVLGALSVMSLAPGRAVTLAFALSVGLGAGFFEELGWTGFANVQIRKRYGVVASGVILGAVWAAWHVLAVLWGIGDLPGTVPLPLFMVVDLFSALVAYRVLMVWTYEQTHSLPLAMLMHASLTSSLLFLGPALTGARMLVYDVIICAILWVAVGIFVSAGRRASYYSSHAATR